MLILKRLGLTLLLKKFDKEIDWWGASLIKVNLGYDLVAFELMCVGITFTGFGKVDNILRIWSNSHLLRNVLSFQFKVYVVDLFQISSNSRRSVLHIIKPSKGLYFKSIQFAEELGKRITGP